jgi:hypothetical protein
LGVLALRRRDHRPSGVEHDERVLVVPWSIDPT